MLDLDSIGSGTRCSCPCIGSLSNWMLQKRRAEPPASPTSRILSCCASVCGQGDCKCPSRTGRLSHKRRLQLHRVMGAVLPKLVCSKAVEAGAEAAAAAVARRVVERTRQDLEAGKKGLLPKISLHLSTAGTDGDLAAPLCPGKSCAFNWRGDDLASGARWSATWRASTALQPWAVQGPRMPRPAHFGGFWWRCSR